MKEGIHMFQFSRHRRLRTTSAMRSLVRENKLEKADLIYPLFVVEGENVMTEVSSMPGVFQYSLDTIDKELAEIVALGIPSVILLDFPQKKMPSERVLFIRMVLFKRPHVTLKRVILT